MELTLILGPMKSGKSFDLISYFAPLKFTQKKYDLFQSDRNVRDGQIQSRNGVLLEAKKVSTFAGLESVGYDVIGIDEIHMFLPEEANNIRKIITAGTNVIIAGLDLDHRGRMFDIIKALLEIGPVTVKYRRAVCEKCLEYNATHTQVCSGDKPLDASMPSVVPDDGTFIYSAVCRKCFV